MKYQISRSLHSDFSVFEENKLAERSYFIPFSTTKKLLESDYKNERYVSDRTISLSGKWDFAYFDKLSKIPNTFDTENYSFDEIDVPSTWQRTEQDFCKKWQETEEMLSYLDVIVDGEFVEELKDISLRFRGSSNQRIIDVKKSMNTGEIVQFTFL